MNRNQLAVAISKKEGKKQQVNIAQIKEILKVILELYPTETAQLCIDHLRKVIKRRNKASSVRTA